MKSIQLRQERLANVCKFPNLIHSIPLPERCGDREHSLIRGIRQFRIDITSKIILNAHMSASRLSEIINDSYSPGQSQQTDRL